MNQVAWVKSAADRIEAASVDQQVLVGFDGFVDEIMDVVHTRHDAQNYDPIKTIAEFGDRVIRAAGLSTNFEMVPQQIKLGGNGPIMANALAAHAYAVHYAGALGEGVTHPVFDPLVRNCASVVTLAEPGYTNALEFEDGKIMMSTSAALSNVNWENLIKQCGEEELTQLLKNIDLLAFNNWTMLPHLDELITGFTRLMPQRKSPLKVFIDLADPAKRTREEIECVAQLIAELEGYARVTFGMNEKESAAVAGVVLGKEGKGIESRALDLRERLQISQVLIHPTHSAGVATDEGFFHVEGPFTLRPKLTTGAGDNFNAGFCVGLLSGASAEESLIAGVASSGFYVRNARSATRHELIEFMRRWAEAGCGEVE